MFKDVKDHIDLALPGNEKGYQNNKRFTDLTETHVLAKGLNKDTTNIFKAGFLSHGLNIGGIIGGVTAGFGGAAVGGGFGTAAGLALQRPGIRKALIEMAARHKGSISNRVVPVKNTQASRILGALIAHKITR